MIALSDSRRESLKAGLRDTYEADMLVSILTAQGQDRTSATGTAHQLIREVLAEMGCEQVSRARSTGTVIELWRADAVGLSDEGGPWVTICEHGSSCRHASKQVAIGWMSSPEEWCETGCRDAKEAKA